MLYCGVGQAADDWLIFLTAGWLLVYETDGVVSIWHKLRKSAIMLTYISYKIIFISMFIGIILLSGI